MRSLGGEADWLYTVTYEDGEAEENISEGLLRGLGPPPQPSPQQPRESETRDSTPASAPLISVRRPTVQTPVDRASRGEAPPRTQHSPPPTHEDSMGSISVELRRQLAEHDEKRIEEVGPFPLDPSSD